MTTLDELLPCPVPWCGAPAWKNICSTAGQAPYVVRCSKCYILGPRCSTKAEAIAAWNTRIASTRPDSAPAEQSDFTDDELIEELTELGNHPCRAVLDFGLTLRHAAARLAQLRQPAPRADDALREALKKIEKMADGYASDHVSCYNCVDVRDIARAALASEEPTADKGD